MANLTTDDAAGGFTIETSEKASYDIKYYNSKLVIDIFNAKLSDSFTVPDFNNPWTSQIRYSQYTGYADIKYVVRVVFQLKDGVSYPDQVSVNAVSNGISVTGSVPAETPPDGDISNFTVVIDAGHGGDDPGAMSDGYRECDVNLAIALRVRDILQSAGVSVLMTRTDDTYVSLAERADFANEEKS